MCVGQSKKGLLPSSSEKPGTLVRQSIHRLKPVKMSKGIRDLQCNPKSSIAQRDTLDFYIYHIDFGLCDRSCDWLRVGCPLALALGNGANEG